MVPTSVLRQGGLSAIALSTTFYETSIGSSTSMNTTVTSKGTRVGAAIRGENVNYCTCTSRQKVQVLTMLLHMSRTHVVFHQCVLECEQ